MKIFSLQIPSSPYKITSKFPHFHETNHQIHSKKSKKDRNRRERLSLEEELKMDMRGIVVKLGMDLSNKVLIRKAEELRRLCDVQFDSSIIGVGEVCKAIICLEIAATKLQIMFERKSAIKMSGMSEKAYMRSFNAMQNSLGVKSTLDVRELSIQFGCVRIIPFVQKGLSLYKERFLASLPASRRLNTDFNRPVFTVVSFYLCAKKHKLKVDKLKLMELCGTSESEFTKISTSMSDLCYDIFGISKEKKDSKSIKGNRDLLDALPGKRKHDDDDVSDDSSDESSIDDQPDLDIPSHKRHKKMEKKAYENWKSTVLSSNDKNKTDPMKKKTQAKLSFEKKPLDSGVLQA